MLDYIASKTAYNEHEQRVRSQIPALVYDGWLRDQQAGWITRRIGQLYSILGGSLSLLGHRLKYWRAGVLAGLHTVQEQSKLPR